MKKYIFSLTMLAAAAMFTACDKETEGQTWTVYYPAITLEGSSTLDWEAGVPFVDPGFAATLNGEDLTDQVSITTTIDYADPKPGMYSIVYEVSSPDGYSASASRRVYIWDKNDKVAGYYTSSAASYRNYDGTITPFGAAYPEVIVGLGGGKYYVTDFLGGWYQYRAGYGANYAMTGQFSVDDAGNITLLDSYLAGWGDGLDDLENGKFDAATNTVTWDAGYAGIMVFHVEMTKDE